jgi:hypothetical protein
MPQRSSTSRSKKPAEGLHFTQAVRAICGSMTERVPLLGHIDMRRVAVGFCQARKGVPHGLQASLTPLRFENGARSTVARGRQYTCQTLFDGDLRRHNGRCYVHGPSQRDFDRTAARLAGQWLATEPPEELYGFLRYDFRGLNQRYGTVFGERYPTPKLVPIKNAS